jgi:hypothetical protein
VNKGDILNDCISHPDKYTERHVAVALAKPLLQALAHLHANNIIHRQVGLCLHREAAVLRLQWEATALPAGSQGCCMVPCSRGCIATRVRMIVGYCDELRYCIPAVLHTCCPAAGLCCLRMLTWVLMMC